MHIDTSSMWLRAEKDYTKNITLDKLIFDSKKVYFKIHPREARLENIQLIEGIHKGNYKIRDEEYYIIDGKYYGTYDTISMPVCFVKADVIFDNHKEGMGSINGIIRPVLDENNEIKHIPPEFHFYLLMPDRALAGHSLREDDVNNNILHINMTAIDQTILNRFKHIYIRKSPHIVPSWFEIKTYHDNNKRKENFSKGIFVTNLEQ